MLSYPTDIVWEHGVSSAFTVSSHDYASGTCPGWSDPDKPTLEHYKVVVAKIVVPNGNVNWYPSEATAANFISLLTKTSNNPQ